MKKLSLFVTLFVLSLMLVACSDPSSSNSDNSSSNNDSTNLRNNNIVHSLSGDRFVQFYSGPQEYGFFFVFLNRDGERISSNATLNLRIVNDNGIEVYSKTHNVTNDDFSSWTFSGSNPRTEFYGRVAISPDEITASNTSSGTMYFQFIAEGNISFRELSLSISNLPSLPLNLQLPEKPLEVSRFLSSGTIRWKLSISEITYEYDSDRQRLTVSFAGQKTFDTNGNNYARTQGVSVRLIDSDGFVVESKSFFTPAIMVGEGFRNQTIIFYDLPYDEYVLEIIPNQN
jgi:hypothetical protein